MKTFILFVTVAVLLPAALRAQDELDVLVLKNGRSLEGTILKEVPDDFVRLQLQNGRVADIRTDAIARIVRGKKASPVPTPDTSKSDSRAGEHDVGPGKAGTVRKDTKAFDSSWASRVSPPDKRMADMLPLAPVPEGLERPEFSTPYMEIGISAFIPDIGDLQALSSGNQTRVLALLASVVPLDEDRDWYLVGQFMIGDEIVGMTGLVRLNIREAMTGIRLRLGMGVRYSGYHHSGNVIVSLSTTYPVFQIGVNLVRNRLDVDVEYPIFPAVQSTFFEGRRYTASPSGPAFSLILSL